MVGVISTSTVCSASGAARAEGGGVMWMSARLMTESCPSVWGCSGSEMVEIKSASVLRRQSFELDRGCISEIEREQTEQHAKTFEAGSVDPETI